MDQPASMELVLYTPPETERNDSMETPSERFLGENDPKHVLAKLRGVKYRERTASWGKVADSSDLAIAPNSIEAYEYCLSKTQKDTKSKRKSDPGCLAWADLNKLQRAAIMRDGLPGPCGVGMLTVPWRYQPDLQTSSIFRPDSEPEVNARWSDTLRKFTDSMKVLWVWMADVGVVLVAVLGMFYLLGCYLVE